MLASSFRAIIRTVCFIGIIFVFILLYIMKNKTNSLMLVIRVNECEECIDLWEAEDGINYFFIPSFVDENTIMRLRYGSKSVDAPFDSTGFTISGIDFNHIYEVSYGSNVVSQNSRIVFKKSSNVGTVIIDTPHDNLSQLETDRNKETFAEIKIYDKYGLYSMNYGDFGTRGNSSWGLSKKPYKIQLKNEYEVLGMSASKNWILLPNMLDGTNLRNKIVLDFAKMISPEWQPGSEFADVYIDGDYKGLYLIVEKPELADGKIPINNQALSAVCQLNYNKQEGLMLDSYNMMLEVENQKQYSKDQINIISKTVLEMEEAILNDFDWQKYIDTDSWALKYIIDELFANSDSGFNSNYFYYLNLYDSSKSIGGPVWDFDDSLGRRHITSGNPETLYGIREYRRLGQYTPWYAALCEKDDFKQCVRKIWNTTVREAAIDLIENNINDYFEDVYDASEMNYIRWKPEMDEYAQYNKTEVVDYKSMRDWISKRISFLDELWIDNIEYCLVYIEDKPGDMLYCYAVKKNSKLQEVNDYYSLIGDQSFWYIFDEEGTFDAKTPVKENMILLTTPRNMENGDSTSKQATDISEEGKNYNYIWVAFCSLAFMFVALILREVRVGYCDGIGI